MDNNDIDIDKRQARRAFEQAADSYDEAAVLQNEIGDRLMERLDLIRMQPLKILDLGCGTGVFTGALMKRYRKASVVAFDLAHPMLQKTRRRGGLFRKPRCVCGDAEALPFADNSFDFIFSNLMLQWCTDLESTLADLRRVLAPGGFLQFATFGPDTLLELRESWGQVDGYTHVNRFVDLHDVGDTLLQTGWSGPVMDAERITVTYRELRGLMLDLKHIGAHNVTGNRQRGLTGKQRLEAVAAAYERFRVDGVLPATYEVVYGHAWSPDSQQDLAASPAVPLTSLDPGLGGRHGG
jgi:malonyl-CoA O-methyltransferase